MDKSELTEGWKKTLQQGEAEPSADAWENIVLKLDQHEVKVLRQRVVLYKWTAAACITIALLAVGANFNIINTSNDTNERIASLPEKSLTASANQEPIATNNSTADKSSNIHNQNFVESSAEQIVLDKDEIASSEITESENEQIGANTVSNRKRILSFASSVKAMPNVATKQQPLFLFTPIKEEAKVEEVVAENKIPLVEEQQDESRQANRAERFWTAVGFSAGTFSNTTPSGSGTAANVLQSSAAGQTAASESNSPGYTYSVNIGVGKKISKRWLLQGGMSYIAQMSDYTATSVIGEGSDVAMSLAAASLNEFEKQTESNTDNAAILASTPYSVNNTIQIISFPVQAGFIVFERKLALQINSGVATDLFLQNTITPNAENLESTTQGRGDDSPYRPINVSGLFGTELSYKMGHHYRVALSPGIRYPFNSIYKTDLGIQSTPLTFDVSLRFRYIFK